MRIKFPYCDDYITNVCHVSDTSSYDWAIGSLWLIAVVVLVLHLSLEPLHREGGKQCSLPICCIPSSSTCCGAEEPQAAEAGTKAPQDPEPKNERPQSKGQQVHEQASAEAVRWQTLDQMKLLETLRDTGRLSAAAYAKTLSETTEKMLAQLERLGALKVREATPRTCTRSLYGGAHRPAYHGPWIALVRTTSTSVC